MNRAWRARAGYHAGVALTAGGVGWELGPGWGLALVGVGLVAGFVWLYDVDDPQPEDQQPPSGMYGGEW